MSKTWPKWVEIRYYDGVSGSIVGYKGCMNNSTMILDVIYRFSLTEKSVIRWVTDGELLDDDGITKLFQLFKKHRKEIEEKNEKWKTVNQKPEDDS